LRYTSDSHYIWLKTADGLIYVSINNFKIKKSSPNLFLKELTKYPRLSGGRDVCNGLVISIAFINRNLIFIVYNNLLILYVY